MRPLSALLLAVIAFFSSCANSRAQAPQVYYYKYPCNTWREPARIVTNQPAGRLDTTLAFISGRIVNNTGSVLKAVPVLVLAKGTDTANPSFVYSDSTGHYCLYVHPGPYTVEFSSLEYAILKVNNLVLHSGEKHHLDVFLEENARSLSTCVYKSERKLSPTQYRKLQDKFARMAARHARLHPPRPEIDGSAHQ